MSATAATVTAYKPLNASNWFGVSLKPTSNHLATAIFELVQKAQGIKQIYIHTPGQLNKFGKKYEDFHITVCYAIDEKNQAAAMEEFNAAKLTTDDIQLTDHPLVFDNRATDSKTAFAVLHVKVSQRYLDVQASIVKKYAGLLKDNTYWFPREPHCTMAYAD